MDRFYGLDFATTTTWSELNPMWVRCAECGQMPYYDQGQGKCQCGQPTAGASAVLVMALL